jgi:hypothetical protein
MKIFSFIFFVSSVFLTAVLFQSPRMGLNSAKLHGQGHFTVSFTYILQSVNQNCTHLVISSFLASLAATIQNEDIFVFHGFIL